MSTILITGASGFIGRELARAMAERHEVICISRNDPETEGAWIQGNFGSSEDLAQLDGRSIDVVIHLGAVTATGTESDAIVVNSEGTRTMMRYMIDHGCRKFVMASSIALVGFQNTAFRPREVPIPDEHPCLDRHFYGFSKYLMEQITRHVQRQAPNIDVINLRLSSVAPDEKMTEPAEPEELPEWSIGHLTMMPLSEAVRAFSLAAEADHVPGVRIMNASARKAWVSVPVAERLRGWWGDDVDLSHYEQPGHEYDSVFDVSRIEAEIGFVSEGPSSA